MQKLAKRQKKIELQIKTFRKPIKRPFIQVLRSYQLRSAF